MPAHRKKESKGPKPEEPKFSEHLFGDASEDVKANKDLAAVSYLWVMSVIVLFLKRDSPFIRFHARQGAVLFLLSIPLWFIPFFGQIGELVLLAGMVYGFLNAAQGLRKDVPIVGPLSRGDITIREAWKQAVEAVVRLVHAFRDGTKQSTRSVGKKSARPKS